MNQIRNTIEFVTLSLCLLMILPSQSIAVQNQKVEQAYDNFYSLPLAQEEVAYMCLGVHSNIIVRAGDKTILFDPTFLMKTDHEILGKKGVDLVIYTHGHGDHYEKSSAVKLFKNCQPYIAIDPSLKTDLEKDIPADKLIVANSGSSLTAGNFTISAIKGKHIGPIMLFRITVNGVKIFHGGDSAYVPLETMTSDIAFVPTGYPSPTCKPKYAYKMVSDIKPSIAVPMHGGDREHKKFAKLMKKNLPGTLVTILEPYAPQKVFIRQ